MFEHLVVEDEDRQDGPLGRREAGVVRGTEVVPVPVDLHTLSTAPVDVYPPTASE